MSEMDYERMAALVADYPAVAPRVRLRCHASVLDALRLAGPPPTDPGAFNPLAFLTGVDVFVDESYAEGEWRLCRASPGPEFDEVLASGVLESAP